ncbi:MAG: hypothetical protein QOI48_496 [Solirubrobacteraceae bacterium]|jgi:hypothetical protein|nr:hypothetical protein [Solirubrobacteraceae bacterium]
MVRPAVQRYAAKSSEYLASVRPSPRRDLLQERDILVPAGTR